MPDAAGGFQEVDPLLDGPGNEGRKQGQNKEGGMDHVKMATNQYKKGSP